MRFDHLGFRGGAGGGGASLGLAKLSQDEQTGDGLSLQTSAQLTPVLTPAAFMGSVYPHIRSKSDQVAWDEK